MIKKVIFYVVTIILAYLIAYLIVAFFNAEFNVWILDRDSRGQILVITVVIIVIALVIKSIPKID